MGAALIALNVDLNLIGFILFLISSASWGTVAWKTNQISLFVLQSVFGVINVIGIIRSF